MNVFIGKIVGEFFTTSAIDYCYKLLFSLGMCLISLVFLMQYGHMSKVRKSNENFLF